MRISRYIDVNGNTGLGEHLEGDRFAVIEPIVAAGGLTRQGYRRTGAERIAVRRLCPVVPVNIFGIGLNYRTHAIESGMAIPAVPVVFMKPTSSVAHPGDEIEAHRCCDPAGEIDYEVELVVLISRMARDVAVASALDYVGGYTVANDISARRIQLQSPGGQWIRGKALDGFCPMGPVLVTPDEIPDPQTLRLRTLLNGTVMQESTTADMIFSVAELISSLSSGMTLLPGTVILTGTPQGVGFARKPPVWLKVGDRIRVEIDGIGALENTIGLPRGGVAL
jgi:2-keto-4-pentenoate hydratase/2-oxohepta-3-ene-1,7-dioic acid hydratase in catechol pathway